MHRGLSYYLKIYQKILIQDLKSKMSYRADFIISMFGMIITNISGFVTFWLLFQNFPSIMGWSYYEMLFMYGFSMVALTPMQCFFDNNWNLRDHVYSGNFIKYCFRPINIFFYYMSEVFDIKGIGQFCIGIGTLWFTWKKLHMTMTVLSFFELVLALLTSSFFMIAVINASAATCFWMQGSGYFMITVNKFKDYARYPITIFSPVFRFIFTFIVPIAFIAYYPSQLFLRPDHVPILTWLSPFIGILFFYLSYLFWTKGAKSYSGTGS